jgi:hypothetical protein
MSKNTAATAAKAETVRTFKAVNGENAGKGSITFIRPKQLAEEGTTGVVAEGIYEGTQPNSFEPTRNDYKVRDEAGNLIILNATGSLNQQMAKVATGSYVRVSYSGMKKLTQGKLKGKSVHNFLVEVEQ